MDDTDPKPPALPVAPEGLPLEVRELPRWACWTYRRRRGRWTHQPVSCFTRETVTTDDGEHWSTFEQAIQAQAEQGGEGVCFSLRPLMHAVDNNPPAPADDGAHFVAVTLEDCRDPNTGRLDPWAAEIVDQLSSYTEATPEGTGVRVLAVGVVPQTLQHSKEEIREGGSVPLTGARLPDAPAVLERRENELVQLFEKLNRDRRARRRPEWVPDQLEDFELLNHALQATNGDKLHRLWKGDPTGYNCPEHAALALFNMLVYWTGRNQERAQKLFTQSGLGHIRTTALAGTLKKAMASSWAPDVKQGDEGNEGD
jgi:primase-polymerase (primpol)-like protein